MLTSMFVQAEALLTEVIDSRDREWERQLSALRERLSGLLTIISDDIEQLPNVGEIEEDDTGEADDADPGEDHDEKEGSGQ